MKRREGSEKESFYDSAEQAPASDDVDKIVEKHHARGANQYKTGYSQFREGGAAFPSHQTQKRWIVGVWNDCSIASFARSQQEQWLSSLEEAEGLHSTVLGDRVVGQGMHERSTVFIVSLGSRCRFLLNREEIFVGIMSNSTTASAIVSP